MDMQEGQEDWVEEIPNPKRPRYQGPSMMMASGSTSGKGFGSNVGPRLQSPVFSVF